jgi:hypothetical protein
MGQGAVCGMFNPIEPGQFAVVSYPRDKSFKLIELGFLQILPAARLRRAQLSFVSAGFDEAAQAKLHSIYRRHDVSGEGLPANASAAACLAWLRSRDPQEGDRRFECLSFLGTGSGADMFGLVLQQAFRPGLIHCADRDSCDDWPMMRTALLARNYSSVGELDGAELFVDPTFFATAPELPQVASFDVFDTLIARRCLEPWRVFEMVAERAGLPDFAEQRRQAEARVITRAYVFDDIYDELASHYGWTPSRRREVQELELACESDVVIPIAENLVKVRDGDLLVSDMYLSEAHIRGLLAKAGLKAHVGLYVESHGKSSGRVWPRIQSEFKLNSHLGDNPQADAAVPNQFGIATTLTRASDVNLVERTLLQAGLRDLALFCREARLSSWHEKASLRALLAVQTSVNLPLLILASIALARRAKELGNPSLSFCSRDCNLWRPLFELIQGKMGLKLKTNYFLTSRIARKKGSDAYLRYAAQHMGAGHLVVDLCGTGWSLAHLADRLGLSSCDVFLIDHCPPLDIFEQAQATPPTCHVHKMFDQRPKANNIVLELANQADHAMVVDMRSVGASLVPLFAPNAATDEEREAISVQRACFFDNLKTLSAYSFADVLDLDDPSIAFLASSLYEYVSKQTDCFGLFGRNFLSENEAIVKQLVS